MAESETTERPSLYPSLYTNRAASIERSKPAFQTFLDALNWPLEKVLQSPIGDFVEGLTESVYGEGRQLTSSERENIKSVGQMILLKYPEASETFGKRSAAFAAGLAADIFLDPITYITAGGGSVRRLGIKALSTRGTAALAGQRKALAATQGFDAANRFTQTFMENLERANAVGQRLEDVKGGIRFAGLEIPGTRVALGAVSAGAE